MPLCQSNCLTSKINYIFIVVAIYKDVFDCEINYIYSYNWRVLLSSVININTLDNTYFPLVVTRSLLHVIKNCLNILKITNITVAYLSFDCLQLIDLLFIWLSSSSDIYSI